MDQYPSVCDIEEGVACRHVNCSFNDGPTFQKWFRQKLHPKNVDKMCNVYGYGHDLASQISPPLSKNSLLLPCLPVLCSSNVVPISLCILLFFSHAHFSWRLCALFSLVQSSTVTNRRFLSNAYCSFYGSAALFSDRVQLRPLNRHSSPFHFNNSTTNEACALRLCFVSGIHSLSISQRCLLFKSVFLSTCKALIVKADWFP